MDKLARTESSPRRTTREERPVHPCTRDLVFSLATCGSLFVLGSWSLTAAGCSAQTKTNEQRTAQRRNMNPVSAEKIAAKEAAKAKTMLSSKAESATEPRSAAGAATVTFTSPQAGQPSAMPITALLDDDCNQLTQHLASTMSTSSNWSATKIKPRMGLETGTLTTDNLTDPLGIAPLSFDSQFLTSSFTRQKYYLPDGSIALRGWMPIAAPTTSSSGTSATVLAGPTRTNTPTTTTIASPTNAGTLVGDHGATGTASRHSTNELSQLLADAFAASSTGTMDPLRVWFTYASLAVSNPDIQLPEGWSSDLLPAERDRVLAAHSGFVALGRTFRDGMMTVDSATRQALVAALAGEPAFTIPRVDLCSKVVGYGDYSPIGRRNFLLGSTNRVIVYSELDGFKSNLENGKWTTRLATRVSIVSSAGKESAWCRTPEWTEVVDTADNRRSEFFLGEIIPISSNLAMGTYFVKVEVKDLTSGAVTSSVVPFKVLDKQAYAAATDTSDIN